MLEIKIVLLRKAAKSYSCEILMSLLKTAMQEGCIGCAFETNIICFMIEWSNGASVVLMIDGI